MRIIFMGDSTMQYNDFSTYPQTGWVQEFSRFLKSDVQILNFAKNGRSTKSFITENRFAEVLKNACAGDFAIIQFGHNDEKVADKTRYTAPDSEYKENLLFFCERLKEKGVLPVIFTSIARRNFGDSGRVQKSHGDYPQAALDAAKTAGVPAVDMERETRALLDAEGKEKSLRFFMNFAAGLYPQYPDGREDNTHLRPEGAYFVSKIAAEHIAKIGDEWEAYKPLSQAILREEPEKTESLSALPEEP